MNKETKKPKALNGTGSTFWTENYNGHAGYIRMTTEWDQNGKRIRIRGFGHTPTAAVAAHARAVKKREAKLTQKVETAIAIEAEANRVPTFTEFTETWLHIKQPSIGEQTYRKYRKDLENHILPHIGHLPLDKPTVDDFHNLFYRDLANVGTSARLHAYKTFSFLMNTAFDRGLIKRNFLKSVATPKHITRVSQVDEENISYRVGISRSLQRWLAKPETPYHDHYARIMFMFLGLRRGEILGMTWGSIHNLEKKGKATLTVSNTLQRHEKHTGSSGFYIQPYTKNKKTRIIHLPEPWRKALLMEKAKNRVAKDPQFKDLVFLTPEGNFYSWKKHNDLWTEILTYYVNIGEKVKYDKLPEKKYFRPHAARHVAASVLFDEGVPVQQAARILGHSSTKMTEYYTHFMEKKMAEGSHSFSSGYGYKENEV